MKSQPPSFLPTILSQGRKVQAQLTMAKVGDIRNSPTYETSGRVAILTAYSKSTQMLTFRHVFLHQTVFIANKSFQNFSTLHHINSDLENKKVRILRKSSNYFIPSNFITKCYDFIRIPQTSVPKTSLSEVSWQLSKLNLFLLQPHSMTAHSSRSRGTCLSKSCSSFSLPEGPNLSIFQGEEILKSDQICKIIESRNGLGWK